MNVPICWLTATQTSDQILRTHTARPLDIQRMVALILFAGGAVGVLYGLNISPENYDIVFDTAKWIFISLVSYTMFFIGWAGLRRKKLTAFHLKIIDLIWVSASAVAVALAAIQATQVSADTKRNALKHNIEQSRSSAKLLIQKAYTDECLNQARLDTAQCESLRRLGRSLEAGGSLSLSVVGEICPRPINLSAPPVNFDVALIQGCISANYAAAAEQDPLLADESNVMRWRLYAGFWPQLLILLVALRVTKSAAEVFWRVK